MRVHFSPRRTLPAVSAAGLLLALFASGCDRPDPANGSSAAGPPADAGEVESAKTVLKSEGGGFSRAAANVSAAQPAFAAGGMQAHAAADRYEAGRQDLAAPPPMTATPAASGGPTAKAAQANPNFYISSTYMGGSGERDHMEKLISEGVLVDGRQVKLEAFSRNYAQAFPIPSKSALAVTAATERTKIIEQGDRTYLQVGLQAMKGEMPRRPRMNVALVIDSSGSMGTTANWSRRRPPRSSLWRGCGRTTSSPSSPSTTPHASSPRPAP